MPGIIRAKVGKGFERLARTQRLVKPPGYTINGIAKSRYAIWRKPCSKSTADLGSSA